MEPSTEATLRMVHVMAQVHRSGLMVLDMKVNGNLIKRTGKVNSGMPMVMFMKAIGRMTKQTDLESMST